MDDVKVIDAAVKAFGRDPTTLSMPRAGARRMRRWSSASAGSAIGRTCGAVSRSAETALRFSAEHAVAAASMVASSAAELLSGRFGAGQRATGATIWSIVDNATGRFDLVALLAPPAVEAGGGGGPGEASRRAPDS